MDLYINHQKFFEKDHSFIMIHPAKANVVYIEFGNNFRPGVWAGTEGLFLRHSTEILTIIKVDFWNKRLECIKS